MTWGDTVTVTKREGLSADLPTPGETWQASKVYITQPFAKRGELDQGILAFTWLSLKLVAQGYAIALILGTPLGSSSGYRRHSPRSSIRSSRSCVRSRRSPGFRLAWCSSPELR
jgi:nitrate/nitrite transport system permease protein